MKISNVIEIYDSGEFVTIVTMTGTSIHLPMDMKHSITIADIIADEPTSTTIDIVVDLNQGA